MSVTREQYEHVVVGAWIGSILVLTGIRGVIAQAVETHRR